MYYSFIGFIAILLHILLNHEYFRNRYEKTEINRIYFRFLLVVLFYYITDSIWGIIYRTPYRTLLYTDTVLYYIAMSFTVVLLCRYVMAYLGYNNTFGKVINALGFFFFIFEIVILAINHFVHIFFWIDQNSNYQAYYFRYIVFFIQIFLCILVAIQSGLSAYKKTGTIRRRYKMIYLFCLEMVAAIAIQILFPFLPIYTVGMMIGIALIHIFVKQDEKDEYRKKLERSRDELAAIVREKEENLNIVSSLSDAYICTYYINLETKRFRELNPSSVRDVRELVGPEGDAVEKFTEVSHHLVDPGYEKEIFEFTNLDTLSQRLAEKNTIEIVFLGIPSVGWCYGEFIAAGRDESGKCTHALWVVRCIQEQRMAEEQHKKDLMEQQEKLKEALDQAEAANAAKTIFLNNMSHDIRTPMNAILGFAKLMENKTEDPEVISRYITKIEESGEYLLSIINNVLDMARIESGKIELNDGVVDVGDKDVTAIDMFEEDIAKKSLTFTKDFRVTHRYVVADPARMRQIFVNLLSNSIKYTPEGGSIHLSNVEIPCDREGYATYVVTVSDTGIGMSKEFREHIFESFSREKTTTESRIIGTGLGMSIVKKLIDLMGGTIEVESEVGQGTKITITLTLKYLDSVDAVGKEQKNYEPGANIKSRRILLAEDNALNAEIAIAILEEAGLLVECASDGVKCVDMLVKSEPGHYDLILMDIQMPNLNGYDSARKIRSLADPAKAGIPIIAMTANAFEEDKKRSYESGMNAHIAKPIDIRILMETLEKILDRTQ